MKNFTFTLTCLLFSIFSYSQENIWTETFTDQNNKGAFGPNNQVDLSGITKWSVDISAADLSASSDYFKVKNDYFTARDTDGECIWISETITITDYQNVKITLDVWRNGDLEASDYIKSYFKIDNEPETLFGESNNDFSDTTHSVDKLEGNQLKIIVKAKNNAGTEKILFDNIRVTGTFVGNHPPAISNIDYEPDKNFSVSGTTISATIQDSDGQINSAQILWGYDGNNLSNSIQMINSEGNNYEGSQAIPAQAHSQYIFYKITATDNLGTTSESNVEQYYIYPRIILSELCDPEDNFSTDRFIEITNLESSEVSLEGFKVKAFGNGSERFSWDLSGNIAAKSSMSCGDTENTSFTPDFADDAWSNSNSYWNGSSSSGADGAGLYFDTLLLDDARSHGNFENASSIRKVIVNIPADTLNANNWILQAIESANETSGHLHLCQWMGNNDSNWENAANWKDNQIPNSTTHALINDGNFDPQISNESSACDMLILDNALVYIPPLRTLSLTGDYNANNDYQLIIESDENGNGSLMFGGSCNSTLQFYRYIEGYTDNNNGWHMISAPVSEMPIANSDFDTEIHTDNDLYQFDEASNTWQNYKQGHFDRFENGKGYFAAMTATGNYLFKGYAISEDVVFNNLSLNPDEGNGWHLLGNPFCSAIKWSYAGWDINNISGVAKIWNEKSGNYLDISSGEYIPATNAFFVHVSESVNSITIPKKMQKHEDVNNYKWMFEQLKIRLSNNQDDYYDLCTFGIQDSANIGYDIKHDSYKLFGAETAPQLALSMNNDLFSTNYINYIESFSIDLFTKCPHNGTHELNIIGSPNFSEHSLQLEDIKLQQFHDLSSDTVRISFDAQDNDSEYRFRLHFKEPLSIDENKTSNTANVYYNNNTLFCNNFEQFSELKIYDSQGKLTYRSSLIKKQIQIKKTLAPGIYLVVLSNNKNIFTTKISISNK